MDYEGTKLVMKYSSISITLLEFSYFGYLSTSKTVKVKFHTHTITKYEVQTFK